MYFQFYKKFSRSNAGSCIIQLDEVQVLVEHTFHINHL